AHPTDSRTFVNDRAARGSRGGQADAGAIRIEGVSLDAKSAVAGDRSLAHQRTGIQPRHVEAGLPPGLVLARQALSRSRAVTREDEQILRREIGANAEAPRCRCEVERC